jgi:hypothetical protein
MREKEKINFEAAARESKGISILYNGVCSPSVSPYCKIFLKYNICFIVLRKILKM